MAQLTCQNLCAGYDGRPVLQDLTFELLAGDYLCIVGENGSGKSTLMKTILGLQAPISGRILTGDGLRKNEIGYLPQQTVVQKDFPASVREIVLSGCQGRCGSRPFYNKEEKQLASDAMDKMQITRLARRCYRELSGGQQQRVAIARTLAPEPTVLFMDEPLSNLDAKLRVEMRSVIRHTQKSVGITTVYVTHDQEEAMAISDRIAVMKDGVIQHVGTPRDIYQRPKNVFVATFIGRTNIVNAHVKDGIITFADGYHEHIDALDKAAEQDVRCSIRPEEFIICKDGTDGIHGTVQECTYLGLNTHYTIDTDQGDSVEIVEESSIGEGLKKGEKVLLKVKKEKINVFTKDGGTNLIRSDAYEKQ